MHYCKYHLNVNQPLPLHSSLPVFYEKKARTQTLDLLGIAPQCFCDTKQELGEGNNRIIFSNGKKSSQKVDCLLSLSSFFSI